MPVRIEAITMDYQDERRPGHRVSAGQRAPSNRRSSQEHPHAWGP
jgi:hypothetical protein